LGGEAAAESDIDLAAEFDPDAHVGLFRLTAIERRLADILENIERIDAFAPCASR
jgi:predicted nucleotidyltransferase